jgi:peptidoglycan/LPS O-acetylase OafA/YrhL
VLVWVARLLLLFAFRGGNFGALVLMPFRMDGLALGMLVAWALRHEAARPALAALARRWRLLAALGVTALAALAPHHPGEIPSAATLAAHTALAGVFGLLVAIVASVRPPGLIRVLSIRLLAHLGRHSYFVYLWHALIGAGVVRLLGGSHFTLNTPSAAAIVALAIGATWGTAVISWKLFEGPLIAWGHRHSY